MSRRHAQLLTVLCLLSLTVYLPFETSTSQAAYHSLSLNGTSGYVSVPNSASLSISGAITIEAWIKVNAITGNYQDIVCKESWGQAGTGGGYEFSITNTGKVRLDLYQSHNQYTTVIGNTTVTTGAWHHVVGVFDGSQMRVYLNGVLDGSLSTGNGPAAGTSALHIGKSTYTTYYFGGLIDEVRISAAALYSANFTPGLGPGNNVSGLWKFNGQTANDFSVNGNHGTLQSGATYSTDIPTTSNNAPTVSITDPQHNTSFAAGSTIIIDAVAADSDGIVSKVDFYQGTTLLGNDTSSPYTFAWSNVPGGVYSITAKATDDNGAVTTSSAITINVFDSTSFHSLSLNGTSGYVSVPNSASLSISGAITIEAWIKVNSITGNYQDIVCKESWGQAGSGGGYEFSITSTGKVRLDLYQSHNQYTTAIGNTTVTTNTWHHVAGVFDGSQMRVYLNGVLDGSLSTGNGPAVGTSALHIGKSTYTTYYFGGLIDEVRISAAALYSANFTPGLGPANNTRALWRFDGQTTNDSSGNGNHGTLQTGATYSTSVPAQSGGQRPVPVAGGPYNGQTGQAVQFSSSGSFDPDGTIVSYRWNFGDGTATSAANPSHTYTAAGLYTATLTVTDNSGLLASGTSSVNIAGSSDARLDPLNETGGGGENPLSRNFNWNLPLVSLPGRAGMDLGLMLSYNSLVWTKSNNGSYVSFDDDHGFPAPGFRLGFPVIQPPYYNSEVGKNAFLLISPDGSRTELRQVGTSSLYEAADSSHLLLDAFPMILRASDGTQLTYALIGSEYNCTQIKDRNGNYISVEYTAAGVIDKVIDTLGRQIKFNYSTSGLLYSITQIWNQGLSNQVTQTWAGFTYTDTAIQTNFSGVTVYGPANNSTIKTLSKVTLPGDLHFEFSYTGWGQVWKVSGLAGTQLLNYRAYNLPGSPLQSTGPQSDCPRFTQRRDWARYWNGDTEGVPVTGEEAVTSYLVPVSDTWLMPDGTQPSGTRAEVTLPDGTLNKIYYIGSATSSGWSRGLPALVETHSEGSWKRKVMTTWTQDNTAVSYPLNPRVLETNIYDPEQNRARTEITYEQFDLGNGMSCHLPRDLYEYAANAEAKLRSTRTLYNMTAAYKDRRILGLVSEKQLYEGDVTGALRAKVAFLYDESGSIQGTDAPVQHDNTNYTASFVAGRGNLSSVKRYNVDNTAEFTTTRTKYNTAGAVVSSEDALEHKVTISYADSFYDGNNSRNTLAYPTTVTDPDLYSSTAKYNFDFGAVTSKRTPLPNVTTNTPGPEQSFEFDSIGRLQRITNSVNSAYTRFEYSNTLSRVDTYTTIQEGLGEARSFSISDGHGRVVATAKDHPGSVGGFSGQKIVYDIMGRVFKTSNPTETNASGTPSQWTTAGDDAAAGWIYVQQTYDWKGRPLVTTNQDATTKTASYSGCGCAGGEVVTLTDEGTLDAGIAKRRQQKIYSDVLGRTRKVEVLNWDGTGPNGTAPNNTVYSTTVNTYNARDQVEQILQYAGPEGSGTNQVTSMTYDGYGRLKTRHVPEQNVGTNTTYDYFSDDTLQKVTDARGASVTYAYNNRQQLTSKTYFAPTGITPTPNVSFTYDATGNRTSMIDGLGSVTYNYNQLSRMSSETRDFTGFGNFTINYQYNLAGELSSITNPSNVTISYTRDSSGRVIGITGTPFGGVTSYASNVQYRAWGAIKSVTYGNSRTLNASYNSRSLVSSFSVSGKISKTYDYYADGKLRFSSDLLDHRFDRFYSFDHVSRLKQAFSGAEARGEPATTNRPYKQTYGYDAFGHLTARTNDIWWTDMNSTSDTYVNNRHLPQGTAWTYDPDGRVQKDFIATNTYDAAGDTIHIEIPSTHSSHTTFGFDGDGQQVKTEETTWNEELQTDSTEEKYYLRSSVLDGRVLTEIGSGRTFVYFGSSIIAWQVGTVSWGAIEWEHKDPSGASVRYEGSAQELDPLGGDAGTHAQTQIPDEGPLLSYGSSYNAANPNITYSKDGIRVTPDNFMAFGGFDLINPLTILEDFARATEAPKLPPNILPDRAAAIRQRIALEERLSGWPRVPDLLALLPTPQATFDELGIEKGVLAILGQQACKDFAKAILDAAAKKREGLGTLEDTAMRFFAQEGSRFTRNRPTGSRGSANPIGSIAEASARIYLERKYPTRPGLQLSADIDGTISELFHLAAKGAVYSDKELANALNNTGYWADAYSKIGSSDRAIIDPRVNPFDFRYVDDSSDPDKSMAYSRYFHTIQSKYCTNEPNTIRGVSFN